MITRHNSATIAVVWRRDLMRFFREKTRIAGALIQPLIFWLVIGRGMGSITRVDYKQYFFPGVLIMIVLFSAIFTTMSVIEDRQNGFLQGVLVGPGARWTTALGKCAGSATIGVLQALAFAALAPWAGFDLTLSQALHVLIVLSFSALGLCAVGFSIAWLVHTTQAYHVLMSIVLMPAWIISGALFPLPIKGTFAWLVRVNPLAHMVDLTRHALASNPLPNSSLVFVLVFISLALSLAFTVVYHR